MQEVRLDYTHCTDSDVPNYKDGFGDMPSSAVHTSFRGSDQQVHAKWAVERNVTVPVGKVTTQADRCYLQFTTPEDMSPPVLFFYYLTNFYQNHRRYAESMDADQLKGTVRSYSDISSSKCTPLYGAVPAEGGDKKPYYPCGLIANSMFNDSYTSPQLLTPSGGGNDTVFYNMTDTGIAWDSDKDLYGETGYNISQILPPPNWAKRFPDNYTNDNPPPNLKEWEAFQVWMRTAGLPTFSKLYQRNDSDAMKAGSYQIVVDYRTCIFASWHDSPILTSF